MIMNAWGSCITLLQLPRLRSTSSDQTAACGRTDDTYPTQVWLADAQALLDAATDRGGGGERTVRYLQTAIEDIASALRRAWRLQPEVRAGCRAAVLSGLRTHKRLLARLLYHVPVNDALTGG